MCVLATYTLNSFFREICSIDLNTALLGGKVGLCMSALLSY